MRSRLTYSCQNWNLTNSQFQRLDVTYRTLLRRMIRGGFKRIDYDDGDFRYKITNDKLHEICKTSDVSNFIRLQQKRYAGHVIRMPIERNAKQLMFNDDDVIYGINKLDDHLSPLTRFWLYKMHPFIVQ